MTAAAALSDRPDEDGSPEIVTEAFEGSLARLVSLARAHRIDVRALPLETVLTQLELALAGVVQRSLGRAGDWVVLGSWLIWLRSQFLLPQDAPAAQDDASPAPVSRDGVAELGAVRALANWLQARPQLGRDVLARGRAEDRALVNPNPAAQIDVIEFLWVAMGLLGGAPDPALLDNHYRPGLPRLFSVGDAETRVRALLQGDEVKRRQFRELMPDPDTERTAQPDAVKPVRGDARWLRARSAVTSTLSACLEMAKQGEMTLTQDQPWEELKAEVGDRHAEIGVR